jgi:branched-chain amino acid transport system substrate-binding protein
MRRFALSLLLLPCAAMAAEGRAVKVALVVPAGATSSAKVLEQAAGLRMAFEEVNQRGGVLPGVGLQLEVVAPEAAGDSASAALARQLAADPELLAVVGHPDSEGTLAALPAYSEAGISLLVPWASDPAITHRDYRNVFRLCPDDDDQADEAAAFALRTLRKRKVVVVNDGSPRGAAQAQRFKEALRAKGVREQALLELPGSQAADPAFGVRLGNLGPNLIYYAGGVQGGVWLLQQVESAKLQVSVMGGDTLYSQAFIDQAGDAALGAIVTYPLPNLRKVHLASVKAFIQRYRKANGGLPGLLAAPCYDVGRLLVSAIAQAGVPEREALRRALAASSAKGLAYPVAFDANGDNLKRRVHFYVVHRNSESKRIEFVFRQEG